VLSAQWHIVHRTAGRPLVARAIARIAGMARRVHVRAQAVRCGAASTHGVLTGYSWGTHGVLMGYVHHSIGAVRCGAADRSFAAAAAMNSAAAARIETAADLIESAHRPSARCRRCERFAWRAFFSMAFSCARRSAAALRRTVRLRELSISSRRLFDAPYSCAASGRDSARRRRWVDRS
jgi:hypothetical protein